ncbi:MAG: hypothetical protein V4497_01310 [Bacteroidota bacterium]
METIFDHNPTPQELIDIRFDAFSLCLKFGIETTETLTPELYQKLITQENAWYDLAVLYEFRENQTKANEFWNKLPKEAYQNGLGFDCISIAV